MNKRQLLVYGQRVLIKEWNHKNYTGTIIGTRRFGPLKFYTVQLDQTKIGSNVCNFLAMHLQPITKEVYA